MGKTKTIQKKLFIAYRNLIVAIITAFAIFLFAYIWRILSAQTSDMMTSLLTAGINQTDMEIRRMDTISLNISYSEIVKNNFEKLIEQKKKMSAFDPKARAIIDSFVAINGPLMPVQQINIYSMQGQVLSTGFTNKSIKTDLASKAWYEPTLKLDGKKYIYALNEGRESYMYNAGTKNIKYMALNRILFDKYGQYLGILEVITKDSQIFKSIDEMRDKHKQNITAYIFDQNGHMVYPYNNSEEAMLNYQTFIKYKNDKAGRFFRMELNQESYNIYYQQSAYTGWTVVLARPVKSVMQPIITLAVFMLVITSFFIGVALLTSFFIAKDLSNPIKQLLVTIKNTQLENLDEVGDHKIDTQIIEIEELDAAFKDMRIDIKHSTEALLEAQRQELKARMLALQSQMNPHFLYNTLTNISVMAEEGLNERIVEMCSHVSFLLRYFSAAKPALVKVSEEFECAEKFLSIVKIRYKHYLEYSIEMEEAIKDLEIPRNIVQPLVENAAKYGMNEEMLWNISVKGYLEKEGWRIKVSDRGMGFTEDKIEELKEKIHKINAYREYLDLEINGMGFINVYSRLKLTYGEDMFFKFGNDKEAGAFIIIGVNNREIKETADKMNNEGEV